ncbi:hypothetical protein ACTQ6A_13005 [Lachnospiraceae bacterium LCP25S3_G4]
MKNRQYKKLLAMAMVMALIGTGTPSLVVNVCAADKTKAKTEITDTKKVGNSVTNNSTKDETVYAKINPDGSIKEVIVSDQLKNVNDLSSIKDISCLSNVENVKGNEKVTQLGDSLVWNGDGNDICYQGTTQKELPVSVNVTYKLDGKDISAADLVGKSGHVTIHYDYDNHSKQGEVYTPFLMVTGMVLDTDKYSNIDVINGKVSSDGERNIAIGMALPKLKESLGLTDIDIPDYFEVSADVTEYEPLNMVTVATNEIFNEIDDSKFDSLDELKDSMGDLQDASNKLVDGSGQLKDGLDQLLSKSGELTGGIGALAAGGNKLAEGTGALAVGTQKLQAGVSGLSGGIQELGNGLLTIKGKLPELKQGATGLREGSAALADGMETEVKAGAQRIQGGANSLAATADKVAGGMNALTGTLTTSQAANQAALDALGRVDTTALDPAIKAEIDTAMAKIQESLAYQNGASTNLSALANGVSGADESMKNGALALAAGSQGLMDGSDYIQGKLLEASQGAGQIEAGVDKLDAGITDGYNGTQKLIGGTNLLSTGVGDAQSGANQLAAGATELNNGLGTLQSGAGQLIDGVQQLDNGSKELNSGMIQFNEEGIQKLADAFSGDIEGMLEKMGDVVNASKEYKNFSGISEGMDGSVKFIFMAN